MEDSSLLFLLLFVFATVIIYAIIKGVVVYFIKLKSKFGFKNIGEDEKYISEEGIDAIEQTLGFRKFLLKVDDTKLKTLLAEDPTYFEKVLPYAIALGVGNHWIKKCMKYLSDIKDADRYDAVSSKIDFSKTISNELYKIDHPHDTGGGSSRSSGSSGSSSRSSGSSGSSGGGWSGGGGGGGGGGSW